MKTYNCLKIGSYEIITNACGSIDTLRHGKKTRHCQEAADFIRRRPKLNAAYNNWLVERREAVAKWLHETPHFRFDCDGGSLAVRIDGGAILRVGCGGDGNHPVYIVSEVPDFFSSTGVSIDNATIEPLDYDCGGGNPLCSKRVKSAFFYRYESAIAIAVE